MTKLSLYSANHVGGLPQVVQMSPQTPSESSPESTAALPTSSIYNAPRLGGFGQMDGRMLRKDDEYDCPIDTAIDVDVDSVDEGDMPTDDPPPIEVSISPALLNKLVNYKSIPLPSLKPPLPEPSAENALVLYRPLNLRTSDNDTPDDDFADNRLEPCTGIPYVTFVDDDAMDVEL